MSVAVKRWAKRQDIADPTLTAVLMALAGAADTTGTCDLAQAQIARLAAIGERACRNALATLVRLAVIRREKRGAQTSGGRLPDLIHFATERTFSIDGKAVRMCRKGLGSYRHDDAGKVLGVSGTVPVSPTPALPSRPYKERARTSSTDVSDLNSATGARGQVWFDQERGNWRSRLLYEGLKLDLGRHECKELAEAECRVRILDIEHASRTKMGTPREPVSRLHLDSLNGQALCDFLLGADDERDRREAAGQGVEGTSSLAGFGAEPHGSEA